MKRQGNALAKSGNHGTKKEKTRCQTFGESKKKHGGRSAGTDRQSGGATGGRIRGNLTGVDVEKKKGKRLRKWGRPSWDKRYLGRGPAIERAANSQKIASASLCYP